MSRQVSETDTIACLTHSALKNQVGKENIKTARKAKQNEQKKPQDVSSFPTDGCSEAILNSAGPRSIAGSACDSKARDPEVYTRSGQRSRVYTRSATYFHFSFH